MYSVLSFYSNYIFYLIDFDLARKEGDGCYPLEYNTTGIARHQDATPGKPMKKEHDRYALAEVIKTVVCLKHAAAEKKKYDLGPEWPEK